MSNNYLCSSCSTLSVSCMNCYLTISNFYCTKCDSNTANKYLQADQLTCVSSCVTGKLL